MKGEPEREDLRVAFAFPSESAIPGTKEFFDAENTGKKGRGAQW